jgi:uncharacterized protein YajQ (UPF0234 family)
VEPEHVMQTQNQQHVDELFQIMQQQVHLQHIHKHGIEVVGHQQQIGENYKQHVILIVIQIIHGIVERLHVMRIQKQQHVDEVYQVMQQQVHLQHIHKHGIEVFGHQQQIGENYKQHVILIVTQIMFGIEIFVKQLFYLLLDE